MTMNALPKIRESEFQSQVMQFASLTGWLVYHTHDSRRSVAGFPDLVLIRRERVVVAELKVGKRKTTPAQQIWLRAFADAGVAAYVWRPEHFEQIREVLS